MEYPRSTQALLDLLPATAPLPALDIASSGGAVALVVGCAYVNADLTACTEAREAGVVEVVHTDTPPPGPYRLICFDARTYDPGLAAETLAAAAARLSPDGLLLTTARLADVSALFARVEQAGEAILARSPLPSPPAPAWSEYSVTFQDQTFRLQTAPGVFSPGGLDEGTRLMLTHITANPGDHFLDLGCGTGVVSRIASALWHCQVTAVDVNARALRLAALNAPEAEVIASDGFTYLSGRQFDLIASNPPYHTDFAVARAFIEGAFSHLSTGGTLYLVVKRADWYVAKVRSIFGGCRQIEQDGYTLIISEKRAARPRPAESKPATTRKHAQRMAEASKKRTRR